MRPAIIALKAKTSTALGSEVTSINAKVIAGGSFCGSSGG